MDTTVEELKSLIASQSGVPADEQRLIYAGQVLKDQRTLRDHGYKGGNVIHLVRSKKSSSQSASPSAAPQSQQREPAVGMPSAFGMPPGGGLAAMQQELQRNPDAFNAMFEVPLVHYSCVWTLHFLFIRTCGLLLCVPRTAIPCLLTPLVAVFRGLNRCALVFALQNPMMDRLLENPETVRAMMMANPEVSGQFVCSSTGVNAIATFATSPIHPCVSLPSCHAGPQAH